MLERLSASVRLSVCVCVCVRVRGCSADIVRSVGDLCTAGRYALRGRCVGRGRVVSVGPQNVVAHKGVVLAGLLLFSLLTVGWLPSLS